MYKKIFLGLISIFCLINPVFAYNHPAPDVNFDIDPHGGKMLGIYESKYTPYFLAYFSREPEKTGIIESANINFSTNLNIDKSQNGYSIYYWEVPFQPNTLRVDVIGAYLFRENEDKPMGYCLFEPFPIKGNFFPIKNSIKNLNLNLSYYSGKKYPNILVEIYEKDHNDYIERYAIVKSSRYEELVMDAMYPKIAEKELSKFINNNIEKAAKALYNFDVIDGLAK